MGPGQVRPGILSTKEMLGLFSNVRLGISLNLIDDADPGILNLLMVETSPAHLAGGNLTPVERDIERAKKVREKI